MILLLLTSALALSFVPLTSNAISDTIVTVGTVAYDPATKKLTIPLTAGAALSGDNAFELAIFESEDGDEEIGTRVNVKTLLVDTDPHDAEFALDPATVKADLEAIYIDVIETETDGDDVTTRSMLTGATRIAVGFAKLDGAVTVTATTTEATFTITLDKDLTTDLADTKFVFNEEEIDVAAVESETKKCTVTLTKEKLLAASSTTGYIKGTDLITTTLSFSLFAKPDFTLEHVDATKTHATANDATAPAKVWIEYEGAAGVVLDKVTGQDYYAILYTKLNDAVVYYTDENGIMTSNKLDITLPAFVEPSTVEFKAVAGATEAPKVKFTFAKANAKNMLIIVKTAANEEIELPLAANEVALAKFVGTDGYYITKDGDVPKSLPCAFDEATFAVSTATDATKVTVEVELTPGYYAAVPAGILTHIEGEATVGNMVYTAFTWSDTDGEKASVEILLSAWKAKKDKKIVSYVCPDYSTTIPAKAEIVALSDVETVIDQLVTTTVAIGAVEFTPADLKLKIKITAGKDISTTATGTYRLVGYSLAAEGVEVFEKEVAKTSLVGTEKEIEVVLAMDAKLKDLKTIHIDVLEKQTGKAEQSMITTARKEVEFAAKATATDIAVVASGTDSLKFTITLDSAIADVTKVAFVFKGANKTVTAGTGTNAFDVTIAIADLLEAESTIGYFLGENQATTTLPISLFALNPDVTLEHKDDKKAEATIDNVPEGSKVYLKSGETTEELTLASKKCDITYAKLADAVIYYTDADGVLKSNKLDITLPAFTAPTTIEWIAEEEEEPAESNDAVITHTVKFTFAAGVANRKLYVTATTASTIDLSAAETETTPAKLVGTAGYYIVVEGTVPKTLPLDFEEAAFTQTPGDVANKKVPVAVEITPGLLKAEPAGLLVYATEETDKTKMKFYPFTWDLTEANKASASVEVDDFKTITDKDIESYVAPDYSAAIPDTRVLLSEKAVVIAKKEPVEPEPKDEGAFGQMVSLMAVVVSLFVLAL